MKKLNNKGAVGPATIAMICMAGMIATTATIGTGASYVVAGKEQAKKNTQSIWAHITNQCGAGSTDARCLENQ